MANTTDPFAQTVHGTNPQYLIEKITRSKIYNCTYWKEECFGLTAASLLEKAVQLKYIGGCYGGNLQPTKFLCLVLKLLQLQPEPDVVLTYIANEDFKYVRALGLIYIRLTSKAEEVYRTIEPFYHDFRKLAYRNASGWSTMYMDDFVDDLLHEELVLGIAMPHMIKRIKLEELKVLEPRSSVLEDELEELEELERMVREQGRPMRKGEDQDLDDAASDDDSNSSQAGPAADSVNEAPKATAAVVFNEDDDDEEDGEDVEAVKEVPSSHKSEASERTKETDKKSPPRESTRDDRGRSRDREGDSRRKTDDSRDRKRDDRKDRDDSRDRSRHRRRRDDSEDSRRHKKAHRRSRSRSDDSRDKHRSSKRRDEDKYERSSKKRRYSSSRSRSPRRKGSREDSRDRKHRDDDRRSKHQRDDSRDRQRDRKHYSDDEEDHRRKKDRDVKDDVKDVDIPKASEKPQKNEKLFDKMFGKKKASTTAASSGKNAADQKVVGKVVYNDKGEKFIISAPEGTVEYWNQVRASLGMSKLK